MFPILPTSRQTNVLYAEDKNDFDILAQTFLSATSKSLSSISSPKFSKEKPWLFVHFCTCHSLFNPLQSSFCSQCSAKSAIIMVTKKFLIPTFSELQLIWYHWKSTTPFIPVFLFWLYFYEHICLFPHSIYLCFT